MFGQSLSVFFSRICRGFAVLACTAGTLASCTDPVERTQVVVVIDAEESLRDRIRYVDVEVRSGSVDEEVWDLELTQQLMPRPRDAEGWPLDFRLVQPEAGTGYLVAATAKAADDETLTVVRALSGYVRGRTRELHLRFDEACVARTMLCPKTYSCRAGRCTDPFVPTEELAPPSQTVTGREGGEPSMPSGSSMQSPPTGGSGSKMDCTGPSCGMTNPCKQGDRDCAPVCATRDEDGVCQACATGFLGSAASGCTPALIDLRLLEGTLEPAFDPAETSYTADLSLLAAKATLRLEAAATVELLVNGAPVAGPAEWSTPLELGDNNLMITLNAVGHPSRTYRVNLRRSGAQRQKLTGSESKPGDAFGVGLAASDGRLAVGAPNEDGSATDSGAVYIFERTPEGWQERAYLKAEQPRAGAHFGHSVALDRDRLAVAAPEDDGGGAVYVFERVGGEWMRVATFREVPRSLLGRGLALQGDLLAVGAPGEQASNRESGSVFLYTRDAAGSWQRSGMLVQSNPGIQDWVGSSVALDGDTLATGATGATVPGQTLFSGAVYAFQREGDDWRELPLIAPTQVEPSAFFGEAIAIEKDTLAATGFFNNVGLAGGTAYVFTRGADGVFTEEAVLRPTNTRGGDWFGTRIAIAGETIVVGASRESSAAGGVAAPGTGTLDKSGAVYLFERGRSGWRQVVEIKSEAPIAREEFGRNVAVLDGELFVAASSDVERDGKSPASGSVYVFR